MGNRKRGRRRHGTSMESLKLLSLCPDRAQGGDRADADPGPPAGHADHATGGGGGGRVGQHGALHGVPVTAQDLRDPLHTSTYRRKPKCCQPILTNILLNQGKSMKGVEVGWRPFITVSAFGILQLLTKWG